MTPNCRIIALLWYTMCCLCGFVPNWVCTGQGALGALGRVQYIFPGNATDCTWSAITYLSISGLLACVGIDEECTT